MHEPVPIPWSALTDSLAPAWRGMKARLFQPFDLGVWLSLGFTAWISVIGQGGHANFDFSELIEESRVSGPMLREVFAAHGTLILGGAVFALVFLLALAVALLWLRCRGRFMLLDNIAGERAEVKRPWRESAPQARSLFAWSLGFWTVVLLLLAAGAAVLGFGAAVSHRGGHGWAGAWPWMLATLPWMVLLGLAASVVALYVDDFILPIMHRHRITVMQAWRTWWPIFRGQMSLYLVFALVRFAMAFLLMLATLIGGLLTCCCLFVLLMIPYVYAVVLLPVIVFSRLYGLEFLRYTGPDFDLLSTPAQAAPPDLPSA